MRASTLKIKNIHIILLLLILVMSFFLRIYKLADKPVWYDEAVSIAHAEKPMPFYIFSPRVNYKPVYFFLLKGWIAAFGEDAFNSRLFSVIWGVFSVLLLYLLARLMFNRQTGIIAAFLLAISVFHIFHCQQIRQFSLITLLGILSVFLLFKFKESKNSFYLFMLGLINILIINTHPYGFCIIVAESIFGALQFKGKMLFSWGLAQIPVIFFIILWLILPNKEHLNSMLWWIPKPNGYSLIETFNTFSWGGPRYGLDDILIWGGEFELKYSAVIRIFAYSSLVISIIYFVLLISGLIRKLSKDAYDKICFLVFWLLIPVLISFVLSLISKTSIYSIKHLIIVLPAFYILIARGLSLLDLKTRSFILVTVVLFNIAPLGIMYNNYFLTDWKSGTEYLNGHIKENEAVIVSALHEIVPFYYYFNNHKPSLPDIDIYGKTTVSGYEDVFVADRNILVVGIRQRGIENRGRDISSADFKKNVVNSEQLRSRDLWVMLSLCTNPQDKESFLAYFRQNYIQESQMRFQRLDLYHFVLAGNNHEN